MITRAVGRVLTAVGFILLAAGLRAQDASGTPTPAGTVLSFLARARYLTGSGSQVEIPAANAVTVTVLQVAGVRIKFGFPFAVAEAGTAARLPLSVTNVGNGPDAFTLSASTAVGWEVGLTDSDGLPITTTPVLAPGGSALILASVRVPPVVLDIVRTTAEVTASSSFDPTRTAAAELTFAGVPGIVMGDLNGDSAVTVADIALAFGIALGQILPSPAQLRAGDVSPPGGDGRVTIGDAVRIARMASGLEGGLPGQ